MKQRPPRIRWDCKKCGRRTGTTDSALFQAVTDQLLAVCRSPQAIEKEPTLSPAGSSEFTRLENEINQAMDRRETDPNELLALILHVQPKSIRRVHLGKQDPQTLMLKSCSGNTARIPNWIAIYLKRRSNRCCCSRMHPCGFGCKMVL